MSEEAGAAVTAGLVAHAIEGGGAGKAVHQGLCANCGAALSGRFCAECGQSAHNHRSLGHLVEEALHGVLHFDTKAWRTLPRLIGRPGTLTHDYIHGKRARYISPLALFLFTVFLMFFVFALGGGPAVNDNRGELDPAARAELLAEAEAGLAEARRELEAAKAKASEMEATGRPGAAGAAQGLVAGAEAAVRAGEAQVARLKARSAAAEGATDPIPDGVIVAGDDRRWQDEIRLAAERGEMTVNTGNAAIDERIKKKLLNPDLALYKIQQTAYKFSFLLAPLSIPLMSLLFLWKRGVTLYDHGVFVLYSLAFMSLLFILVALLSKGGAWTEPLIGPLIGFAPPLHMFFQLKGAYGLGWFSAAWRTLLLLAFAFLVMAIFITLIVVLGLVG